MIFSLRSTFHGFINNSKSSRSWPNEVAPDHKTTTIVFDCGCDALFLKGCIKFTTDPMGIKPFKSIHICLFQCQIFQKSKTFLIFYLFWCECQTDLYVFWVSSGSCLQTLPQRPLLRSFSFLLKNYDFWL